MKQIQLAREKTKKILDNFIALIANFNATLKKITSESYKLLKPIT